MQVRSIQTKVSVEKVDICTFEGWAEYLKRGMLYGKEKVGQEDSVYIPPILPVGYPLNLIR